MIFLEMLKYGRRSEFNMPAELRSKERESAWLQTAKVLLMATLFLFQSEISPAQEGGGRYIDEALQMELADQFFNEGDYYGAIREYKRFLFFFANSARAEEAQLKIAKSYFNEKRWDEAISACDDLIKKFPASPLKPETFLLQGDAFAEKKQYPQARISFGKTREVSPGTLIADEAQLQIARTYLKEEKWKEAAKEFREIDRSSKLYPRSKYYAQGLDRIREVPQKSPLAAGVLSAILPGAGQAYSEQYGRAAISFLLNGAFIWGMGESFKHKEYVVGGILTFFELGWYSANILNAVNSAEKYNEKKRQDYIDDLERGSNLSIGLSLQGKTPVLALNYVF